MNKWSELETNNLLTLWPTEATTEFIQTQIPNRTITQIVDKATRMGIKRNDVAKSRNTIISNKNRGRDLSDTQLELIAKQYKCKAEFRRYDNSAYVVANRRGILDVICSHMVIGNRFNYPQMALFEIVKLIYPNECILYNDKRAIKPLEIDVYVPNLKLAFEFDGARFHNTEEGIIKDNTKNEICENNNILLYRIKEDTNYEQPIPNILNQLTQFGLPTDNIDVNDIKEKLTSKYMNIDDIKQLISTYTSRSKFASDHLKIYKFLCKQGLLSMLDIISPRKRDNIQPEDIIAKLSTCSTKREFYSNNMSMYNKMRKLDDVNIIQLYTQLI